MLYHLHDPNIIDFAEAVFGFVRTDKRNGPGTTTLRDHKLYWHRPNVKRTVNDVSPTSTQHTTIKPVKAGKTFTFRIYFENLTAKELGALAWVVQPQGNGNSVHRLGMGKSLGYGSVQLFASLYLTNMRQRHSTLFTNNAFVEGRTESSIGDFREKFEAFLLHQLQVKDVSSIAELDRIKMFLAMLRYPGPSAVKTRAMDIQGQVPTFRQRPVLPDPLEIMDISRSSRVAQSVKER